MADSSNTNNPGKSKRRHKGKKSVEHAGDGAPSPAASKPAQVSTSPTQAGSESSSVKHKGSPRGDGKEKTDAVQPPAQTPTQSPHSATPASVSSSHAGASKQKESPGQDKKEQQQGKQNKGEQKSKADGGIKPEASKPPAAGQGEQKSKAQLKAERRAIQEAQRAAKEAKKNEAGGGGAAAGGGGGGKGAARGGGGGAAAAATEKKETVSDKSKGAGEAAAGEKRIRKKPAVNEVMKGETEEQMWARKEKEMLGKSLKVKIDNSIVNLGFQYFHHNIVGANARCLALLATLKEVIAKYRTPEEKELARDLEKNFLNPCISYINYCRPISTSMGNAIKHLKYHISQIPRDMEDEQAIAVLQEVIDDFIQVNITKAAEAVALYAHTKIDDGDVILIYAASSLIGQVLKTAHKKGKQFRVIVVEGRPRTEGKSMLRCLVRCGIPCSYIYIGSASHAMSEATKVFLGAAAMFAIGDMHSRTGNSMIAALAKANNIPVLVCCETYKFTDKVQLHSADSNLHARGKDLVSIGHKPPILGDWEEIGLGLLNVMYDVTGSEYITALVTELGMLPCTSVPVVLRRQEDLTSQTYPS